MPTCVEETFSHALGNPRSRAAAAEICEVQSAGTLLEGKPDSFNPASTTVLPSDATTLKVRDNILMDTAPSRFLRVKVTAAP